jgi:hypothetical protein
LSGAQIGCKLIAGVKPMSEKHLIEAIARNYRDMPTLQDLGGFHVPARLGRSA